MQEAASFETGYGRPVESQDSAQLLREAAHQLTKIEFLDDRIYALVAIADASGEPRVFNQAWHTINGAFLKRKGRGVESAAPLLSELAIAEARHKEYGWAKKAAAKIPKDQRWLRAHTYTELARVGSHSAVELAKDIASESWPEDAAIIYARLASAGHEEFIKSALSKMSFEFDSVRQIEVHVNLAEGGHKPSISTARRLVANLEPGVKQVGYRIRMAALSAEDLPDVGEIISPSPVYGERTDIKAVSQLLEAYSTSGVSSYFEAAEGLVDDARFPETKTIGLAKLAEALSQ